MGSGIQNSSDVCYHKSRPEIKITRGKCSEFALAIKGERYVLPFSNPIALYPLQAAGFYQLINYGDEDYYPECKRHTLRIPEEIFRLDAGTAG